ncbi:UNVERIFIED_CONTAM: hypothetical protein HDU68_002156 [Siphonaria sp. JEL0065]|nr:hypothetical protein HDU68_002156 [Siphonaria sp. JEL0065]
MHLLPIELVEQIVKHLPIDSKLAHVGLALLLNNGFSFSFARRHVLHQIRVSQGSSVFEFVVLSNLVIDNWPKLPCSYRAALLGEMLAAEVDTEGRLALGETDELVAVLQPTKSLPIDIQQQQLMQTLLNESNHFNVACQDNRPFRWAVALGWVDVATTLLTNTNVDPSARSNEAIRCAASNGDSKMVEVLIKDSRVDPTTHDNFPLEAAAHHPKTLDILFQSDKITPEAISNPFINLIIQNQLVSSLRVLLDSNKIDPSSNENRAVYVASSTGNLEILNLLLQDPRVDPSARNDACLYTASKQGHLDIIKRLLQDSRVNPCADECRPIRVAVQHGHLEVAQYIMLDSRVNTARRNATLAKMAVVDGNPEILVFLLQQGRVDPKEEGLVKLAILRGNLEMVQLFLADTRRVLSTASKKEMIRWAEEGGQELVSKELRKKWRGVDSVSKMERFKMKVRAAKAKIIRSFKKEAETQVSETISQAPYIQKKISFLDLKSKRSMGFLKKETLVIV